MRGQGSRLSLLLRQRIRKNGTNLLPIKISVTVERVTAWYLVVRLLQRFLNEAQDETRAGITRQAVSKKEIYTYFLKIMC